MEAASRMSTNQPVKAGEMGQKAEVDFAANPVVVVIPAYNVYESESMSFKKTTGFITST